MRFAAVSLVLLLAPLSVIADLAIRSSSYKNGVASYDLLAFPNAPPTYKVQLLNTCTGDSSILENDVVPVNGTNTVSLPSSTVPGPYQAVLVNPETATSRRRAPAPLHTYAATVPYNVAASDFLAS
ncbi:hypothetical protein FRB94_011578 [Tulasnella sp. JGI-2019a]|nr:hypothetical protein FRB93_000662 [Tulasnella sp. JGI-2019a]KAG9009722.1 hypothetical protein FRB94_011578 [Tulasnella sp. JGI-2019a]KAG9034194.1 hypothetical protein FRB95_013714 [Tulasnella sp. JGI-2019a]